MSLQALWALFLAHPAQAVNGLALFFGVAGAWLLLATRARERRALARWAAEGEAGEEALPMDEATLRINLFFYRFGAACPGPGAAGQLGQHAALRALPRRAEPHADKRIAVIRPSPAGSKPLPDGEARRRRAFVFRIAA